MGFGAMRLTGDGVWGPPADRDEAIRVVRRAVELGVDFIDTADSYGPEVSEELIAEALHPYPEGLVVATKAGLTRPGPGRWTANGRPEHIRAACEGSLRRLRVEQIPLYQLHRIDPAVPLDATIGALVGLREEGKIRHIGLSEVSAAQLYEVRAMVDVVSVQNRFNLTDRRWSEVVDVCEADGLAFIPWAPIGGGDVGSGAAATLDAVARAHGVSRHAVALAWLLQRSPAVLPIPGTGSVAHLEDNVSAASLELSAEDMTRLSRLG